MNIKKSPCYKCEKRKSGCHSNCDEYKEWRTLMNEISDVVSKNKFFVDARVNTKHHSKCGVYRTRKK